MDLTGRTFGILKVLRKSDQLSKCRGTLWECQCKCGKNVLLASNTLTSGNNKRCSKFCTESRGDSLDEFKGFGEIKRTHMNRIICDATSRGIPIEVTGEDLWNLFLRQKRKCALSGTELVFSFKEKNKQYSKSTTASLDRIDSNLPYIINNLQWIHKSLNKMKMDFSQFEFINFCCKVTFNKILSDYRPSFDQYFLTLSFVVSLRSEDIETKHGSIIVSNKDNLILATGYNGLIRGVSPGLLPVTRPGKYSVMIHSEENALLNLSRSIRDYPGGVRMYVTGKPCVTCLQRIWQAGIDYLIVAKRQGTMLETVESDLLFDKIVSETGMRIDYMDINNDWILQLFKP